MWEPNQPQQSVGEQEKGLVACDTSDAAGITPGRTIFTDLITASQTGAHGTPSRNNWGDVTKPKDQVKGGGMARAVPEELHPRLTEGFPPSHGAFLSSLQGGVQLGTILKEWLHD